MSKNYEKVKNYYDKGLWSLSQVKDAVKCGWITEDEFKEITGEGWDEDEPVTLSLAKRVDEMEELLIDLAEIAVSDGSLELEDIPGNLQDQVRVKLDDDKWKDK